MEEKKSASGSSPVTSGKCSLSTRLKQRIRKCCPKRLRECFTRVKTAIQNAATWRRKGQDAGQAAAEVSAHKRKERSSTEGEERIERKRSRIAAKEVKEPSQSLRPEEKPKAHEDLAKKERERSLLNVVEEPAGGVLAPKRKKESSSIDSEDRRERKRAAKEVEEPSKSVRPQEDLEEYRRKRGKSPLKKSLKKNEPEKEVQRERPEKRPRSSRGSCDQDVKRRIIEEQNRAGGSRQLAVRGLKRPPTLSAFSFEFHALLGQGSFGKVMLASLAGRDSLVAVKVIRKKAVKAVSILKERRTLEVARNSPFLCHGYAAFQTKNCAFLVMEYMAGGSLKTCLDRIGCMEETTATFYAAEMVCGIQYLHSQGIVHRDLKLENILLDKDGHVKIGDFGLVGEGIFGDAFMTLACGTFAYMAPEMHLMDASGYGAAVDWWSFGVVLFKMLNGSSPFVDRGVRSAVVYSIVNDSPFYTVELSREAVDILNNLLAKDPLQRLGVTGSIRHHPFFQQINWEAMESRSLTPPLRPPQIPERKLKRFQEIPSFLNDTQDSFVPIDSRRLPDFSFESPKLRD
ncbi:protein kinase C delta type-like [Spea bombifrons]|uniref:protein kinase C delta type-like n=1 Tax=Spea bombifrons TaxID=233779 RepID=UPI00234B00B0|nr:protein kinase C delta type-like [Spea bombifrons]